MKIIFLKSIRCKYQLKYSHLAMLKYLHFTYMNMKEVNSVYMYRLYRRQGIICTSACDITNMLHFLHSALLNLPSLTKYPL